ncbi:MAG: ComEC/Rec2 family competence protein [Lentisphaeria bacterium]|nr:ComEC/Rec2 family competence protein [Lentisphaeria bacterium]
MIREFGAAIVRTVESVSPYLAVCPAVPALVWLASGVCLGVFLFEGAFLASLASALFPTVFWMVCRPPRLRRLAYFLPIGFALALVHLWAPWRTYAKALPREVCGGEIRAVVVQSHWSAGELSWLRSGMHATVQVLAVRSISTPEWHSCRGRLLFQAPTAGKLPYGTVFTAKGSFSPPPRSPIPGAFDYRRYLRQRGIFHVFAADELTRTGLVGGWRRIPMFMYGLRDRWATALARGVPDRGDAGVLLAMCLGYRQALNGDLKRTFLRSGAVHIFAISGLHVGIVAHLVNLVLRVFGLGVRKRRAAVPIVAALYVAMTGAAPSALRAWMMLSVWCLSECMHEAPSKVNSVAVAAVVLLLATPLNLFQTGFQFSFIIVGALVLGWPSVRALCDLARERSLWIPPSQRRHGWFLGWFARAPIRLLRAVLAAMLAWVGSAGLIAGTNALVIPSALGVNLVLSSLAWCVLALSVPKLLADLLGLGVMESLLGHVLGWLLECVRVLVRLGSASGSYAVPRPGGGVVLLYYAVLSCAFLPRLSARLRVTCFCAPVLLLALCAGGVHVRSPQVVVATGDGAVPAVALVGSCFVPPVVVHTGGVDAQRLLGAWLENEGISELDCLVATGCEWTRMGGAGELLARIPARSLVTPDPPKGSHAATTVAEQRARGARFRELALSSEEGVKLRRAQAPGLEVVESRLGQGATKLKITRVDGVHTWVVVVTRDRTGRTHVQVTRDGMPCGETVLVRQLHSRVVVLSLRDAD